MNLRLSNSMTYHTVLETNKLVKKYVYGAGSAFHWVYEILIRKYNVKIDGVIDDRLKIGNYIDGLPCFSFEEFSELATFKDSLIIVTISDLTIFNKIKEKFIGIGFNNIKHLREIYEMHDPFFSHKDLNIRDSLTQIEYVYGLLEDDKSKRMFESIVNTHLFKKPISLDWENETDQYFDKYLSAFIDYSKLCVCGCGVHDLQNILSKSALFFQTIDCFEPDDWNYFGDSNYLGLLNYIKGIQDSVSPQISAYQLAVHDENTICNFRSANDNPAERSFKTTFGSKVSLIGEKLVQCISLDVFYQNEAPTAIIVDAEGAELKIINGAKKIIKQKKPSLIISTYHRISDLWELPLLIKSINPDYRFFLRNYTGYCSETVLYGVPCE